MLPFKVPAALPMAVPMRLWAAVFVALAYGGSCCWVCAAVSRGAPPGILIQDVGVNTSITFQPVYLEGSDEALPEIVAASRVRIPGWSRFTHVDKFYHTFRVKMDVPSYQVSGQGSKVHVCFDQIPTRNLGDCRNGTWRAVEKGGSWTTTMSPFQDKYMDIRVTKSFSAPLVTVSVEDERTSFRLVLLGAGVSLLVMAPIISAWVPFYYGTAMTLGILMIVIVILHQAMKLLPTGRKSTLWIFMYGSVVGLGTVLLRHVSSLLSSLLWELGFSEDMYSPVAVFTGVGIALLGAYLGYLGVRKLAINNEGNIDEGIAQFVKWALRILGYISLIQSSCDPIFMILACFGGSLVAWTVFNVRVSVLGLWESLGGFWSSEESVIKAVTKKEAKRLHMTQAQLDAVKRLPGIGSLPISRTGLVNPPSDRLSPGLRKERRLKEDEVFPSTVHRSPGYRPPSKQEYAGTARDYSSRAVDHLVRSKEFAGWKKANQHRITVEPNERRQERPEEDIQMTAYLEELSPPSGLFFKYKRK